MSAHSNSLTCVCTTPLGVRLRDVVLRRHLNLTEAARICGVNRATLHNWMSGKSQPVFDQLFRVCRGLRCSADELLGLIPPPNPHRDALVASFDRYLDAVVTPVKIENEALRRALNERRAAP